MSTQEAVLQAYKKDRAADLKRKADKHTAIAEKIAELVCQKTGYETCRCQIDEEFASKAAVRDTRFEADTAKQNNLNNEMESAKRPHELQLRLVTDLKNTYEKLQHDSEQAECVVDILSEHLANQVVEILNGFPPDSWLVDRRRSNNTK